MTSLLFTDDTHPMTEEEYLALPETAQRVELFDGSVHVSPGPTPAHQHFYDELKDTLKGPSRQAGLHVHGAVTVRLRPERIVVPDLVITSKIDFYNPTIDVSSVLLVGEILSSNSATDKVLKMHYYAVAGIQWYLMVDPETAVLRLYELAGDVYTERSATGPGEILHLTAPVDVDIDPNELLPPR